MKNLISLLIVATIIFASCSESPRDKDVKKITAIENKLINDTTMLLDKKLAIDIIEQYSAFSENYPTDSLTPEYLFKAARLSMNMNNGNRAVRLFDKIVKQYPDYNKLAETVFLSAYVYENLLNDNAKAKEFYLQFMKEFPDNVLYKDAKASIDNMGKSLDEIIQGFEKNNQIKEVVTESSKPTKEI